MKITKLKIFNRSVLQKKTPLLGFTVLELAILWVVITGGLTAVAITNHQRAQKNISDTSTSQPVATNPETSSATQDTSPQDGTSTQGSTNTTPRSSTNADRQAHEDAMLEINWKNEQCMEPLDRAVKKLGNAQQAAQSNYNAAISAISYAAGTEQFRAAYNSAAYTQNVNLELSYKNYLSDIEIIRITPLCDFITPAAKKPIYTKMLNANYNYVPYIEGSGLYDY